MKQRPNVTDPQVQETDKRRFQRMRARKRFGKEYLSEIKQCVQKTDYLVNRPTPVKTQRKTISSPVKKKAKKTEKKVDEDDLYPHVKFVIHPRIQNHKIPKFINNQNIHQYSKTMAPVNEDQDYTKRSLSSSDQPKDRYNLSTLSATNVSDSNSSNAEIHDDVQHNSDFKHSNTPKNQDKNDNSSDSFDDSTHMASLSSDKVKKEVKKKPAVDSDYSDSDTNIPKKPMWKFSDSERRGKSSAFSSNDFRWSKNSQINKISSSSDSDSVVMEKIKEEMKKDLEPEEPEKHGTNDLFFGSESNEPQKENIYSIENPKSNKNELKLSPKVNQKNSPIKENKKQNSFAKTDSIENSDNYKSNSSSKGDNLLRKPYNDLSNDDDSDKDIGIKKSHKKDIKETIKNMQEPEIDSDFDEFTAQNKKSLNNTSDNGINEMQSPDVHSQEGNQQYSSDYIDYNSKSKKISNSKPHQYSSDSNPNNSGFNSIPTHPQRNQKNNLYNSQYSSSGDSSRGIRNEVKRNLDQRYRSDEFKYSNDKNNTNDEFNEEDQDDVKTEQDSSNDMPYIDSLSSQKAEKDRISPELEKNLLDSKNSHKHFVETLSDGYDDEDENSHFIKNKVSSPKQNIDFSSSSPEHKEVDIPVSAEGEVDNTFNFASSTSESPSLVKKKNLEIENNIDDDEDNSDIGFGNEDNVFYNGKNSSSSEDYEVVEATTDTRENEIRENRKLDRRIYSGDQK